LKGARLLKSIYPLAPGVWQKERKIDKTEQLKHQVKKLVVEKRALPSIKKARDI